MRCIGVDPGKHKCAWAVLDDGKILCVGTDVWADFATSYAAFPLVIEVPQIYPGMQQKGDQNDLIDVAFAAGKVASNWKDVTVIRPRVWKGTVKKEVMTKRILTKLSFEELANLGGHIKNHNVVDAVGIALWKAGRL